MSVLNVLKYLSANRETWSATEQFTFHRKTIPRMSAIDQTAHRARDIY